MAQPAPVLLSEALRNARAKAHMSQAQLAVSSGVSASYVAMLELGKRKPSVRIIQALAAALECPAAAFAVIYEDSQ